MPWRPAVPGERPTLGAALIDWIEFYLTVVDGPSIGEPLVLTEEQARFVLRLYEVDPRFEGGAVVGRTINSGRLIRRAVLSRCKGWGKSPFMAALCIAEAVGAVVMDGWDSEGRPVGRPWHTLGIKPKVQIMAMSEDQTANTWEPCLDMVRSSAALMDDYHMAPYEGAILVPRGKIEPATSSGVSREGFRPVFCILDQSESWTESNGGWRLARTVRRNLAKVNGCSVETPNAFLPGDETVAEASWKVYEGQLEGRTRNATGVYYDHREGPPETDPDDYDSLREGLRIAYGDSASDNGGWVNLDRIMADYWDTDDPQDARRYYLNQITHASDAWVSQVQWAAVRAVYLTDGEVYDPADPLRVPPVRRGDAVALGFDGSRGRVEGKADATAIIGCRIWDGHLFEVGVWEQGKDERHWTPPATEIDAAMRHAFREYRVMAVNADPSGWVEQVARWEKDLGRGLRVKCTLANPMTAWPKGKGTLVREHLERLRSAIATGAQRRGSSEVTHSGELALTRHVLNARRRKCPGGYLIHKAYPESPNKIDAAYAATMAYKGRTDCLARGFGVRVNTSSRGRMMVLQ